MHLLTRCGLDIAYDDMVNIGLGNDLSSDGTKPLPECISTNT